MDDRQDLGLSSATCSGRSSSSASAGTAQLIRIMRGNLLEILGQQFVTTARAKGLTERTVVNRYAVRVAINPLISVMGMQLPNLISGATIARRGAVVADDWPAVPACAQQPGHLPRGHLSADARVMLMLGNLLADVLLAWVDPRIRYD